MTFLKQASLFLVFVVIVTGSSEEKHPGCDTLETLSLVSEKKWIQQLVSDTCTEKQIVLMEWMESYGVEPRRTTEYLCRMAGWLSDENVDITVIPAEIESLLDQDTLDDLMHTFTRHVYWITARPSDAEMFQVMCARRTIPDLELRFSMERLLARSKNDMEKLEDSCASMKRYDTGEELDNKLHLDSTEFQLTWCMVLTIFKNHGGYPGIQKRVDANLELAAVLNADSSPTEEGLVAVLEAMQQEYGSEFATYILWGKENVTVGDIKVLAAGYISMINAGSPIGEEALEDIASNAGIFLPELKALFDRFKECSYLGLMNNPQLVRDIMAVWRIVDSFESVIPPIPEHEMLNFPLDDSACSRP